MGVSKGDEVFVNEIKAGNAAAFEAMVLKYQKNEKTKKKIATRAIVPKAQDLGETRPTQQVERRSIALQAHQ